MMDNYSTPTLSAEISPAINVTRGQFVAEPFGARVVRLCLCVVIFLVAAIGNILVILVVYKTPSLRSGKYALNSVYMLAYYTPCIYTMYR